MTDIKLLSAQLTALIDIKICGTFLWQPTTRDASLDTPGQPIIPWRTIDKLMALGLIESDETNHRAMLTTAGERMVEPYRVTIAATKLRHGQALLRAELLHAA